MSFTVMLMGLFLAQEALLGVMDKPNPVEDGQRIFHSCTVLMFVLFCNITFKCFLFVFMFYTVGCVCMCVCVRQSERER
uniref:Uncharacterized protein n=1 Tax=Anguilla anguilla TaxID=7936 RepID=A0A0E9X6N3_ANGAN